MDFWAQGLRMAGIAALTVAFVSCAKDPTDPGASGKNLRFEVSTSKEWNVQQMSRSEASAAVSEVIALRGEQPADTLFLHASVSDDFPAVEPSQTRGTQVTTDSFYDSFGVLTFVYRDSWSGSELPDYMYDVEVSKASGWATDYFWPASGNKVRFFAYAPYQGAGIVLSGRETPGIPTFTYTVPAEAAAQQDLLVAAPAEMEGGQTNAAALNFGHILTAVRFVTGDDMLPGSISEISLKGINSEGVFEMDGTWRDQSLPADFAQPLSASLDGTADEEITPAEGTFMMIPQTLPDGATVEVRYTDNLTGTERVLTASIAGAEWPMGKVITYRVSTSSISVIPTFTVTTPDDFTYQGGSATCTVTSYATVSAQGAPEQTVPVKWTAEFVEDDGMGGYKVIPRPEWLTDFTVSGSGSSEPADFPVTAAAQQGVFSNTHNDALQAAAPVPGTYDLSTKGGTTAMNTANCYAINAPGTYSLPLVYGNAIKDGATNTSAYISTASGEVLKNFVNHLDAAITDPYIYNNANCTPGDAVLVWQDEENLVTNVALSADRHSLTFDVPQASIRQGNAIVAVRDAAGTIMWSWHIWVTDYVPGLEPTVEEHYDSSKTPRDKVVTVREELKPEYYTFTYMGVPVGWCDEGTTTYDARSVKVRFTQEGTGHAVVKTFTQAWQEVPAVGNAVLFQFGRKDPMLPGDDGVDKACYSDGYAFKIQKGQVSTIGTAIQNPHVFYAYHGDWCAQYYENSWNMNYTLANHDRDYFLAGMKTIYDPSPVGYLLPPPICGIFLYKEKDLSSGRVVYCDNYSEVAERGKAGTIFFPNIGNRNLDTGEIENDKNFWMSNPDTPSYGANYSYSFGQSVYRPMYVKGSLNGLGLGAYPIKEQ